MPASTRRRLLRISFLDTLLLSIALWSCHCSMSQATEYTYRMLYGSGSNCVSVDPLPGSTINVKYHLPDLKLSEDLNEDNLMKEEIDTEGMDEHEASLLQRQREVAIKRARQGKDVSIAISQRTHYQYNLNRNADDGGDITRPERPRNTREQPTEREGYILFETSPAGGTVQICIHSLFANARSPYNVGLKIEQSYDTSSQVEEIKAAMAENRALLLENTDTALVHLGGFAKEMISMESQARTILASADVTKQEEADHYEQSIRLQKSVSFWPILQLSCLLVAAFMQVRHVLDWMKSKHIF